VTKATTRTRDSGLATEREEATALRGRHEGRWAAEDQERAEAERSREAAFGRHDERLAEVERIAGLLRADRDRHRAKVRNLERERQHLRTGLRSSIEVALERLDALVDGPAPDAFTEWLRRLPTAAEPTPPPPEALMYFALTRDSGFTGFLRDQASAASKSSDTIDSRSREEIEAELKRVSVDLADAQIELERREAVSREAGHAVKAAELNSSSAVTAFLAKHGEQG
jgi:hypothetical protein